MDRRRTGSLAGVRAARNATRRRNAEWRAVAERAFRAEDDATLAAQLPAISDALGPEVAIQLAAERLEGRCSLRRLVARLGVSARALVDEARGLVEPAKVLALHTLALFLLMCAGIVAALILCGMFLLILR